MKQYLVVILKTILSIPIALVLLVISIPVIIILLLGMLIEDLNCWAQKKAGGK